MPKRRFLPVLAALLLSVVLTSIVPSKNDGAFATCTGADPCYAGKNCRLPQALREGRWQMRCVQT